MSIASIKKQRKRITTGKYRGDDPFSFAVFIDALPFVVGISKEEVPYYIKRALRILCKKKERV